MTEVRVQPTMTKEVASREGGDGRLAWVDWMKAIGMLLIVYGHFFSIGHWYVYTFSVPLFFIISGFLCRREDDHGVFWRKLWFNLVVPMVLICAINFGVRAASSIVAGTFTLPQVGHFVVSFLLGFHNGVGTLWFVYTLMLLKLLLQFSPRNRYFQLLLFLGLPMLGMWVNHTHPVIMGHDIVQGVNAIANVCMAWPMFAIGYYARRWKPLLAAELPARKLSVALVATMVVVVVCTKANGGVWMYRDECGNYFCLFLVGGIAGTLLVFFLSKAACRFTPPY